MTFKSEILTREMFENYFEYCEDSKSCLIWKVDRWAGRHLSVLKAKAGSEAGTFSNKSGYWQICLNTKFYLAHRVIFALIHGICKESPIDHIDGDKLNNKIDNLRQVSFTGNVMNRLHDKSNFLPYSTNCKTLSRVDIATMVCGKRNRKSFYYSHFNGEEGAKFEAAKFLLKRLESFLENGYTQRQVDFVKSRIFNLYSELNDNA